MSVRNRNKEIRKVRVGDLRSNPANHRLHPDSQKAALAGILEEVGFVGTLLAFELPDGSLRLLDGHARQDALDEDDEVDVTIVDLDPEERRKVLATHDAIGAMAGVDHARLDALIAGIQIDSPAIVNMLADLKSKTAELESLSEPDEGSSLDGASDPTGCSSEIPERFQIVVTCEDETRQKEILEFLEGEGLKCRAISA